MTRFRVPVPVSVRVPAKVNLQLAVGPRRADGYHDLVTVFHAIGLFDMVTVAAAEADSVAVTGEGAGQVPADGVLAGAERRFPAGRVHPARSAAHGRGPR